MKNIPAEITCEEARDWLAGPNPPIILDVRDEDEFVRCKLDRALNIPLRELSSNLKNLPAGAPILVYCHHGGRSTRATHFLREKGFAQATCLKGGIEQWAVTCDPKMERY